MPQLASALIEARRDVRRPCMATILLHRHEVEEQALPYVCLRCGRPASLWKTKTFILAAPHPAGNVGKLNRIEVPL